MTRHSIRRLCVFSGSNFGARDDYAESARRLGAALVAIARGRWGLA